MHCIRDNDDETACYVLNFGARDGTPRFNSIGDSLQALNSHKPFATVAMVERGKMKADDPNKVFFVVYDAKGKLLDTVPLDNKGFNTFIPGNCLVCHGSGSAYTPSKLGPDGETVEDGPKVVGARFLPFDLSSFLYFSSDSENKFSREKQEPEFKELNRIVLETDLGGTNDDARQLIEGWYGGPGLPNPTFNDDFVPTGWDKKDDKGNARQLYRHVVASTCRSCHISHSGTSDPNKPDLEDEMDFRFGKYEDFTGRLKPLIYSDVCVNHSMPNAEQSLKVLWDSSARAHLLNRLDLAPSVFSSETSEKFECGP